MIYSAKYNCVVYEHSNPRQVAAAIDGARPVNGHMVAIPATLFSLQLARLLGLPAPNLMELTGYDWPIMPGRRPRLHQKYMANFQILHPRSFNLSDMGTMKTLAALWAADYLMFAGVIKRCLIISPLSTLSVWSEEVFRNFIGRRRLAIVHGTREQRMAQLSKDVDFFAINHDGLGVGSTRTSRGLDLGPVADAVRSRSDINLIIVDECTSYKHHAARRSRILRQVLEHKPYIWPMTGTPTSNGPTDAYGQAKLIGNLAGESFRSFSGRTMAQVSQFKFIPRSNSAEIVRKALSPAVRFSRAECIDLPECVVETRDVEMSPTQIAAYKALKKDLQVAIGKGVITAVNEAVLRLKLIQIACGAVYGADHEVHKTDAAPRVSVLKEVIDEAGGKVLVFAPLTSVVNMLFATLKEEYGENSVARVYGGTSQTARSEIFRKFEQDVHPRIIIADPGTMSHGLTLVSANTIVWFGPTDRPEIYDQANARINRPGQTRKMLIVRLASTSIEREIYKRLHEKAGLQGAILKLAEEDR